MSKPGLDLKKIAETEIETGIEIEEIEVNGEVDLEAVGEEDFDEWVVAVGLVEDLEGVEDTVEAAATMMTEIETEIEIEVIEIETEVTEIETEMTVVVEEESEKEKEEMIVDLREIEVEEAVIVVTEAV